MLEGLRRRFLAELPLWRLSRRQLLLVLVWSAWPWFSLWLLPQDAFWPLLPVVVFLPVAYLVALVVELAFPALPHPFTWGLSLSVFALAWLGIVSWRQRRGVRP